ncbi:MBL fold metallo-hydrolase [Actinocrispum wychmicini]|uniref:Glyoxylase-like metal-dependent hydrolase (Beta-lactamase superfamily II) n=1 Tax=Actinocrispum wychmicini TaxID=1213861 RepID=A0A4V2S543_9PSEU|nr:MBL fold metallo-hydrolase [Actinocrispum wychmicini]TCO50730.1 glyoxylase-like metal-dependent hydrolase (beta-lactamase superfamily II) [Actinocrispum wychmicini]
MTFTEVADGVYARRHEELDLTTGLVVGEDACLVIDTRGDRVQGADLVNAVREITPYPWQVVLTHPHFDHFYGTSEFLPCDVWAHENFQIDREEQDVWASSYRAQGKEDIADAIETTTLVTPTKFFADTEALSVGGRSVVLHHFGPAHSYSDTVVHVPDVDVVFAGDLVEVPELTDESFGDGDVTNWPNVLDALLQLDPRIVVPGHGHPVGQDFVIQQRENLSAGWTSAR